MTKRICLGLQRKDAQSLLHGYETGIVRMTPDGEFVEQERPVPEEERAVLAARQDYAIPLPAADEGTDGVPAPGTRGAVGKLRLRFARVLLEGAPPAGDGHGNGHEPPSVTASPSAPP